MVPDKDDYRCERNDCDDCEMGSISGELRLRASKSWHSPFAGRTLSRGLILKSNVPRFAMPFGPAREEDDDGKEEPPEVARTV